MVTEEWRYRSRKGFDSQEKPKKFLSRLVHARVFSFYFYSSPPSTPSYFWDWILTSTESSISGNDLGKGSCQAAVSEESIVSFDLIASHSPASFVPSPPRLPSVPSNSVRNCIIRYVNRFVFFSPPDTSNFFSFSKQNDLYRSRFQLRRFEVREKSTFCQFFLFVFI